MKKMLLHSCCGPCSTQVIDVLKNDMTLLYIITTQTLTLMRNLLIVLQSKKDIAKL